MRRLIVIGLVVFVASVMCAESVATNGYTWTYSVSNGKATVWAVRPSPTGTLNIPASLSGIPLNTIGDSVFQGCSGLAEVTIPDSVSDIGYCAFSECSVLSSVMIPASVTSIGETAFADCTNLSQVELPNGIGTLSVGAHAFDAATVVNVAERGGYAFCWTNATGEVVADPFHSASSVTVSPVWRRTETATIDKHTWTFVVSENGLATIGNGTDVAVEPAPIGDFVIPDEIGGYPVKGIGGHAFAGCSALRSIEIPDSVTRIGSYAFKDCAALKDVNLPDNGIFIEEGAFNGCASVRSVRFAPSGWHCGLVQSKFSGADDFTSSIKESTTKSNVSGVLMGYAYDTSTAQAIFSDPIYGGWYGWNVKATTFGYAGYMHMTAGKTYVFGKYFDDSVRVVIDGIEVLRNWEHADFATGCFIPDFTGWHEVDVRVSDGPNGGEKGPRGAASGYDSLWGADMGIGWRDDGVTDALPESGWNKLMDSGDGSLFRVDAQMTLRELLPDSYAQITSVVYAIDFSKAVPDDCFNGCSELSQITIPDGTERIGKKSFWGCYGATNTLVMPSSVTELKDRAFGACSNIEQVIISSDIGTVAVGVGVFDEPIPVTVADKDGFVFCGWTNAVGAIIADPFHSGTANTVSPWWKKTVTVTFDANGGNGTMTEQMVLEGDNLALASNSFNRDGYLFLGWSDSAKGDVVYADQATIEKIDASEDGAILYAVWKPCAPSIVPA